MPKEGCLRRKVQHWAKQNEVEDVCMINLGMTIMCGLVVVCGIIIKKEIFDEVIQYA